MKCILIANRGEIAVRIIKALRLLNIRSAIIVSDPDIDSLAAKMADVVVPIGGQSALESYLNAEKVMRAVQQVGADGVHPGYGFLSEKLELLEACEKSAVRFIGPGKEAIEVMGDKIKSRQLMLSGNIPVVPGFELESDDDSTSILDKARTVGFPVMVKAAAGGGGKGMRAVYSESNLMDAVESCQREAASSFSDSRVFIEKLIEKPRHIEIQVFGDAQGNIFHLNERECSIQRRHQKIIEEAPASFDCADLRAQMGAVAIEVARLVQYQGAGTVEFIYADDGQFYFLEMNTRLQVEHPVTEMTHNLDLVEAQIRVARGEALPWNQNHLKPRGHALEVRLYAEDPLQDFRPNPGRILKIEWPDQRDWLRIDSGVQSGNEVTPFYDPMIAKLIVWGINRPQAVERMLEALKELQILGIKTNQAYLIQILQNEQFRKGQIHTGSLDEMQIESELAHQLERKLEIFMSLAPALHRKDSELDRNHAFKVGGMQ